MDSGGVVGSLPGVCGGHAILKGHRIEVSNLVSHLHYGGGPRAEDWIASMGAEAWITAKEVLVALEYCRDRLCQRDGLTCCHCSLNPDESNGPHDEVFDGWRLAGEVLARMEKAQRSP